jgi:hypothetical protein
MQLKIPVAWRIRLIMSMTLPLYLGYEQKFLQQTWMFPICQNIFFQMGTHTFFGNSDLVNMH